MSFTKPEVFQTLKTTLQIAGQTFSKAQKMKLVLIVFAQILLAWLDLIGVILIGSLGAISVSELQGQPQSVSVKKFLALLPFSPVTLQSQLACLGGLAVFFFTARTLVGMQITKRILYSLSYQSAMASKILISRVFNSGILKIQSLSKQNYTFIIVSGMNTLYLGVLSSLIFIVSDVILLCTLFLTLFLFNWKITFLTFLLFMIVGYLLYSYLNKTGRNLGESNTSIHVQSMEKIDEVLEHYRENYVRNTLSYQADVLSQFRLAHSRVLAGMNYLPNVTKYIFELFLVLFIFIISMLAFATSNAVIAVSTISIFFIASTRIAPAVLRIQNSFINIGTSLGVAQTTLSLLEEFGEDNFDNVPIRSRESNLPVFQARVSFEGVSYRYPNTEKTIFDQIELEIIEGSFVAIIGPSGAGKSTFIDLLLGMLSPTKGQVFISGLESASAAALFPGKLGYLPQSVALFSGSIRENICMGFQSNKFSDDEIMRAIEFSHAKEFVLNLPQGIETQIGENGILLSGGQLQRIGIARTLITNPDLIVLDEPTSSLDSNTEAEVVSAISSLRGTRTVIVVAHRLSTVRKADKVIYISSQGQVSHGTFSEIQESEKDFFKNFLQA